MFKEKYLEFVNIFNLYVDTFFTGDKLYDYNIDLKKNHTYRVVSKSLKLSEKLSFNENDSYLSAIIALFHDLGRFEQLKKYGSFIDARTEDHAAMAVKIINNKEILNSLNKEVKEIILFSIANHNKLVIPDTDERTALFAKIIRDSDKTDIINVMVTQYQNIDSPEVKVALNNLKNDGSISDNVFNSIKHKKLVNRSDIKSISDYLCHLLSWVYDLYFSCTMDLMKENRAIYNLLDFLPDTDKGKALKLSLLSDIN